MKLFDRSLHALTLVKKREQKATAAAFLMVFILMAAYFVLRPVRDAMASDWSDAELSWLWNIQFFISLLLVATYNMAISTLQFRWVVPMLYATFALSFAIFYFFALLINNTPLIGKAFYLWVTAFSLFNLSVFWSFMADIYSPEQSRRLFACIGAGASAGAMVGPAIPSLFASSLGLDTLTLIAAIGLFMVLPLVWYIQREKQRHFNPSDSLASTYERRLHPQWWSGFADVLRKPYLTGIAAFILLYVFIGAFIYFEQKNLLAEYSRVERTRILGSIDWVINSATLILAVLFTGRILERAGMPLTLALLPLLLVLSLAVLAFAPSITLLLAIKVLRSVGNYAVTRPAREMLFASVTTDERFKAKPVIDVAVYRGGDALSGSVFALLSQGLGMGLATIAALGASIALVWAALGVQLGRKYRRLTMES